MNVLLITSEAGQRNNIPLVLDTLYMGVFTLTVNDNNFLIPKKLYVINNSDSTLEFYVLGNDVYLYEVSLSIEKNPQTFTNLPLLLFLCVPSTELKWS